VIDDKDMSAAGFDSFRSYDESVLSGRTLFKIVTDRPRELARKIEAFGLKDYTETGKRYAEFERKGRTVLQIVTDRPRELARRIEAFRLEECIETGKRSEDVKTAAIAIKIEHDLDSKPDLKSDLKPDLKSDLDPPSPKSPPKFSRILEIPRVAIDFSTGELEMDGDDFSIKYVIDIKKVFARIDKNKKDIKFNDELRLVERTKTKHCALEFTNGDSWSRVQYINGEAIIDKLLVEKHEYYKKLKSKQEALTKEAEDLAEEICGLRKKLEKAESDYYQKIKLLSSIED